MPQKIRFCILCQRHDRVNRSRYTSIFTVEREAKLREGYRRRHGGEELPQAMLNQMVHKRCYNRTVQGVTTMPASASVAPTDSLVVEEDDDDGDVPEQSDVIQSRSLVSIALTAKRQSFERRNRLCFVCHQYGYTRGNKIRQIVSNVTAQKLAQGYAHLFKKPVGKSLLDAHIHQACFRRLHSRYRYHESVKFQPASDRQSVNRISYSPHETRSRSTEAPTDLSIEQLLSTPFSTSIPTHDPSVELSARSCLFRPCVQRLTPEEIELRTHRTSSTAEKSIDAIPLIDPSETLPSNDAATYSNQNDNQDDDVEMNEQETSPVLCNPRAQIYPVASIRRLPPQAVASLDPLLTDHTYVPPIRSNIPEDLQQLHDWLLEQLKSSGYPLSMGEVVGKYREFVEGVKGRESYCRERVRNRLEKYYPDQFFFLIPTRREGGFVALNDLEHHIRLAIKHVKEEKEKSAEASIVAPAIVPPAPVDYKGETCEQVMTAIRKIRLYIRDSKQINTLPSYLIRNLIGLITTSEKNFDKISQNYDFYRMVDEDLLANIEVAPSNRIDKSVRNISLASDLISARHDSRVSQKHFLLADELLKNNTSLTPRQTINLLHRYGHTCSYKSYKKMKSARERNGHSMAEEIVHGSTVIATAPNQSSDSEFELMEL